MGELRIKYITNTEEVSYKDTPTPIHILMTHEFYAYMHIFYRIDNDPIVDKFKFSVT